MSKPKPGLGKGIARTLAHSHSVPTAPTAAIHPPVPLAPVFSTPSRSLHLSSLPRPSPWTPAAVQTHLALLPLWDAPEFGRRTYVTATSPLRASTVEVTSAGTFVPPYHPTSLLSVSDRPQVFFNEFYNVPPPPPPPPAMVLRPSPPHPAAAPQQPRTSQAAHTIISPSPQPQNGPSPSPSPPITFLGIRPDEVDFQNAASIPDPNNLSVYSSNLIFHLGASGCPKERSPTPPRRKQAATTPPPPRPRSFPLPDVTPPTNLQSTAVGEDSYFARVDGVCVADGVGGWSRSGKGADPGRWSRLLTHFCEEEVARWWAGADEYIATDEEVSGWAARAWKRGSEGGRHRRPLDPVEIMQKGFEKCLACAASEVSHKSCLYDCYLLTSLRVSTARQHACWLCFTTRHCWLPMWVTAASFSFAVERWCSERRRCSTPSTFPCNSAPTRVTNP